MPINKCCYIWLLQVWGLILLMSGCGAGAHRHSSLCAPRSNAADFQRFIHLQGFMEIKEENVTIT